MWSNHNNLRGFISQKKLNLRQVRWALKLAIYDFEIFYRPSKKNLTNESSRRSNYEEVSSLNTRLLPTLQNKLALSFDENSLTQSERETLDNLILIFQNELALSFGEKSLAQSEQETLDDLALVLQLVEVFTSGAKIS
jgi:hypothetical protein